MSTTTKFLCLAFSALLILACQDNKNGITELAKEQNKNQEQLSKIAYNHQDSTKWDVNLLQQDIETYHKYVEVFQDYPLNKSPFPVAEYDYAVSSIPFSISIDSIVLKGITIGEYENPDSEKIITKLCLLFLTNDLEAEETTMVESRNYPYLTAQGRCKVKNNRLDWVFTASPDGFSTLLLNMKLFDLRFGETILIYPQTDQSFLYHQLKESPNRYTNFETFKSKILSYEMVANQLKSKHNL